MRSCCPLGSMLTTALHSLLLMFLLPYINPLFDFRLCRCRGSSPQCLRSQYAPSPKYGRTCSRTWQHRAAATFPHEPGVLVAPSAGDGSRTRGRGGLPRRVMLGKGNIPGPNSLFLPSLGRGSLLPARPVRVSYPASVDCRPKNALHGPAPLWFSVDQRWQSARLKCPPAQRG